MSLYDQMILNIARKSMEECDYHALGILMNEFAYGECYNMLKHIHNIIRDESLTDADCYARIEAIIKVFEKQDFSVGNRHRLMKHMDLEWTNAEAKDLGWEE
ncbi:MAG: hypothetical protein IJY50_07115 [Clostridia bacterium]|nr:hypothetical protein [Clostridia bacterium]